MKLSLNVLLICLVASVLWTESFMAQRNILAFKKDWQIAQEGFINPGLNVIPSLIYRKLLSGFRLSTDHLMGVQRLFSKDEIRPLKVSGWFRLGKSAYVDLIVNGNHLSYTGIRLSNSSVYPSMMYEADHTGKYLSMSKLELRPAPGFHSAVLTEGQIKIDEKILKLPSGFMREGKVGVQIGIQDSDFYGLEALAEEKNLVLHFFPEGNRIGLYLRHFLIIALLVLVSGIARQKSTSLVLAGLGFLLFGYSVIVRPQDESIDHSMMKFKIMDAWWKPEGEKTIKEISDRLHEGRYFPGIIHCKKSGCTHLAERELPPPKSGKRIVIFGGSQSMPSLVTNLHQSFHYIFDRNLRKKDPEIETMSVTALGLFEERLAVLENLLPKLEMDEIIIENLSFASEHALLKSFIKKWSEQGVRVIYLRPPVNPARIREDLATQVIVELRLGLEADGPAVHDPGSPEILRTISFFRKAKEEIKFEFFDPNQMLLDDQIIRSGEIFWDAYHFTGYGQKLFADWLADQRSK